MIPKRLHRTVLPWLCVVVFAGNFLCADSVLDLTWLLLDTTSQERENPLPEVAFHAAHGSLTFDLASAQAASTGAKERTQVIDFFKMIMGGIAGLVLFIYGVTRLADSLEELSTERMQKFLSTATTNRFAGVATGIVATTLLESSSVTIIMVIAMVSSGILTFVQSLGVVLGSNIGTAVGAQIISLDIKHYVPALMGLGVLGYLLGRTRTQKNLGLVVLGFGLMFYGLEAIDDAMRPFRNYQPFIDLMQTLGNNPSIETEIDFPSALRQTERGREVLEPALAGTITIDGSSTVFPVTTVMAAAFQKIYPGVHFAVGVSGTGGGFRKFCAGETDITGASRPINATEVELCKTHHIDYIELPVAFDSLSVVVNPQNTFVDCLTVAELKRLWEPAAEGKITHWNQIRTSFPDQRIVLYGPGRDSGTFDYFTLAVVGVEGQSRNDYTASEDDTVLVDGVSAHTYGLGYFGYAYYLSNRERLKTVAIDSGYGCVLPSPQSVADSSYQPLSRPIFVYVKQLTATRPEVQAFVDFYLAPEHANLLLQVGYVPLPTVTLRAASSRFHRGMTGSVFGGTGSVLGVKQAGMHERQR